MIKADQVLLSSWVDIESLRKKSFLITGATGFFGVNLIESLDFLNQEFNLEMRFTLLVRNQLKAKNY